MTAALAGVLRRVRVVGESMLPTLAPGTRVTALRRWRRLRVGDVVLTRDPRDPHDWIVKRCAQVDARRVSLRGDNDAQSTDSRTFGDVPARTVSWIVLVPKARRRS